MTFRIALIVGTRPEAIKMAPLMLAARNQSQLKLSLIATGQQDALFNEAIAVFGIVPDVHLGAAQPETLGRLRALIATALHAAPPDMVLVQGDTNTALAGAQAAAVLGIPIGHVEAGLRTHNPERPFPEENNRVAIAKLASLHFAPAQRAVDNLTAEGITSGIHITGNTGIDALLKIVETLPRVEQTPQHILITCHRRENFGAPLLRICDAIQALATESSLPVLLPLHPNSQVRDVIQARLGAHTNIRLIASLSYPEMIVALRGSAFVLSDSGGVQEECAALGIPLLLMREETERQELIESGNVRLVGSDTSCILSESKNLLTNPAMQAAMAHPYFPYGIGDAAQKIVAILCSLADHTPK